MVLRLIITKTHIALRGFGGASRLVELFIIYTLSMICQMCLKTPQTTHKIPLLNNRITNEVHHRNNSFQHAAAIAAEQGHIAVVDLIYGLCDKEAAI